ncbi:MAG: hypothetical protein ABS69_09760 [Nitrosomonadales bacterium SCN 54-20]|nr:MAG: hypothetical protein ABS69_09760 [Nitrosomonadales bacterium SCN 54-20]
MESTYGSMSAEIAGRRACKWKLLLHAVCRSTGISSGLQANKSRKCNKKEWQASSDEIERQSKHADRMEQANSSGHMGRIYFSRKQAGA